MVSATSYVRVQGRYLWKDDERVSVAIMALVETLCTDTAQVSRERRCVSSESQRRLLYLGTRSHFR